MCCVRNTVMVLLVAALAAALARPGGAQVPLLELLALGTLPATTTLGPTIDATDDGPHVYWHDDSTAVVFYLCDGQVEVQVVRAVDTLRFKDSCGDLQMQLTIPVRGPEAGAHAFDDVSKIFAVSDVHGEYEALTDLLRNSRVVDDDLHWTWGEGHLVVLGDVLGRGDRVTECLWLIYRLEREARLQGGRVHYVLGNHELMVMQGNDSYVNREYLEGIVRETGVKHTDLYGPDMELGRWLRSKHVVIKLNGTLFVHGGLSYNAVERELSLHELNEMTRESLDARSYQLVFSDTLGFLFGSEGPLWYRGYQPGSWGYPRASAKRVGMVLDYYDAEAIVVGHTEVARVSSSYEGRVYGIDVPVQELGSLQALLWQDDEFYRVSGDGELEPVR
jgi:hypothetical protein